MKKKLSKVCYALLPLLFWMTVLSLPLFSNFDHLPKAFKQAHTNTVIVTNILLVIIFYVHHYFIYPQKKKKNGLVIYCCLMVLCLVAYMGTCHYIHMQRINSLPSLHNGFIKRPVPNFFMPILPFALVIATGFGYQQYLDKLKHEKLIKELENIQLKTELAFLTSQIEPHFIFNILNAMVGMARKKSDLLEVSLIDLSQLMRYMLYSNNGKTIQLVDEIDYVKSYIDLQMLRYEDDVKLSLQISGNFEGFSIAPMLLIPFIENAFKHGIGYIEKPCIDISILLDNDEGLLKTMVVNNVTPVKSILKKESGIGLNNVKRRLELLYPGKYFFRTEKKNDTFMAILQLSLR